MMLIGRKGGRSDGTTRNSRLVLHVPELVDKNPNILAVVDWNRDQVQPAGGKRLLQCRGQPRRRRDPPPSGAIGGGVGDEVGIVEGQAPIRKAIDGLFPPDHAVGSGTLYPTHTHSHNPTRVSTIL